MGNKILIIVMYLVVFSGCKSSIDCKLEDIDGIYFKGFDRLKINKIAVKDLKDQTNNFEYSSPVFDTTDFGFNELKINQLSANAIKNGFEITINDSLKYKITDAKMEEVYMERKTMWGKKIYGCGLKEYKLNDSLIQTQGVILISK